jgi:hypothetical protein
MFLCSGKATSRTLTAKYQEDGGMHCTKRVTVVTADVMRRLVEVRACRRRAAPVKAEEGRESGRR